MIRVNQRGDFSRTLRFLKLATSNSYLGILEGYGRRGVRALKSATPVDHGETADGWDYKIQRTPSTIKITWTNNVMAGNTDTPIAILLQYGHGTRNGGYVEGRDYINPAIRPVFDSLAKDMWDKVTKS